MGQKAKKITDKQYQHARKMAFAKSIYGLPKKVEKWIDESVLKYSRYLFTYREKEKVRLLHALSPRCGA